MRKFLIILLLPSFLTISKVVSTEKEVVYTSKEIYYLSQSDFGIYFREKLSSPMVYGEVPVYANEDLVVESGKLTPKISFQITEWRLNKQGIPVFKLSNHQFIAADKRFLYDQSEVTPTIKKVWLESDFKLYNSPYDLKEVKSFLSAYSQVSIDKTMFVEGKEFLHIDQAGWVDKESTSEEDNRMSKVQEMLSEKYQKDSFSIYVKQLTTGKEAGINQDEKMYAASVLKLPYLYYTQEKINDGLYQLDSTVKYVSAVNDFPGSYKPEGSGSLPKKEDNKEYSLKDLITKVSKESDNVAHNILGYYVTNQSDKEFQKVTNKIAGKTWNVETRMASPKMAGNVMEAIYQQNGGIIDALSETRFDDQRISKDIPVKVAHKIGDAYDFRHDVAIVYTDSPFILAIFTDHSDYETISAIAKDIYEVLQ